MNKGIASITKFYKYMVLSIFFAIVGLCPLIAHAADGGKKFSCYVDQPALILAFLGILVVMAKVAGAVAERFKQVPVLGELLLGILLGIPALFGCQLLTEIRDSELVLFVSEFAVIILLFQAGVESNINEMAKVGLRAIAVAIVGVVAPFILGTWVVSPLLFPGSPPIFDIFVGATMTATSVGISARVFKDLGIANTTNAKIVLGAAIFDDVIGLLILAVVNGMVQSGSGNVGAAEIAIISIKAFGFLFVSIWFGRKFAPAIGYALSRVNRGVGMKMALALAFAFGYAYVGSLFGLAPIVGAFAAGLLLDTVHFKRFSHMQLTSDVCSSLDEIPQSPTTDNIRNMLTQYQERHVEHLVEVFGQWFIPVFFVVTGMGVDLHSLASPKVIIAALALTVVSVVGKVVSGFVAGKEADWKIVGFGMVPRGEVGLIFASIAKETGVVNNEAFTVLVLMIILTTFVTPIILPRLINKKSQSNGAPESTEA